MFLLVVLGIQIEVYKQTTLEYDVKYGIIYKNDKDERRII